MGCGVCWLRLLDWTRALFLYTVTAYKRLFCFFLASINITILEVGINVPWKVVSSLVENYRYSPLVGSLLPSSRICQSMFFWLSFLLFQSFHFFDPDSPFHSAWIQNLLVLLLKGHCTKFYLVLSSSTLIMSEFPSTRGKLALYSRQVARAFS